jgi:hypothetical protein
MGRGFNIITHRDRSSSPEGDMVSSPPNHQVAPQLYKRPKSAPHDRESRGLDDSTEIEEGR